MSRRLAMLARILGALGVIGGLYVVLASWAIALPAYEVTRTVVPRLVFSEPLIWFGLALLLTPTLARFASETGGYGDPGFRDDTIAAAYVHCPECEQLVHVGADHCPYCGEKIKGPAARIVFTDPTG